MYPLRVDLQDGFENDAVILRVNGKEIYRKSGVRTKLQIALADSFEIQLPNDVAHVEVRVENRGQSATFDLRPSEHPYLAVSLTPKGQVAFQPSQELFRYM